MGTENDEPAACGELCFRTVTEGFVVCGMSVPKQKY
jgi:hypothetical protein